MTSEKNLYFETGWEVFASERCLKYGDFLVFKYHKTSLFEVHIFGKNGIKKVVVASPSLGVVKIEKEEETLKEPSHAYKRAHNEEMDLNGSSKKSSTCRLWATFFFFNPLSKKIMFFIL